MKKLLILSLAFPVFMACNKKNNSTEYFSFDANGVHYDYPREETDGSLFVGGVNTLGAGRTSTTVGYQIYAFSLSNPTASGEFQFLFNGNHLPTQDTVYIDGHNAIASITNLNHMNNSFYANGGNEGTGKVIFTSRTSNRLEGTFEFQAKSQNDGSFIHITNGKFSIIPAQ